MWPRPGVKAGSGATSMKETEMADAKRRLDDLLSAEPMVPSGAAHVLLGYGVLEGAEAVGWDPPGVVLVAVYSVGVALIQRATSRFTWKRESVVREKASAADAVRRRLAARSSAGW